jgi:hypothetical protein
MYQDFVNKYCGEPIVQSVTEEEIIQHFTKYIEKKCKNRITLIQYSMPDEFYERIIKEEFFKIICHFIEFTMNFEVSKPVNDKLQEIYDSDYDTMKFKQYYRIAEKTNKLPSQQFVCLDLDKITKVVFIIYKSKI